MIPPKGEGLYPAQLKLNYLNNRNYNMPSNIQNNCVKNNVYPNEINAIDLDENDLDFAPTEVSRDAEYFLNEAYNLLSKEFSAECTITKKALFGYACLIKADDILQNKYMKNEYFLALAEISKGKEIMESIEGTDALSSKIFKLLKKLQEEISEKIDFEMKTKMPKEVVEQKNILREVKTV